MIIGLAGRKGVGKSRAAKIIQEVLPECVGVYNFAAPIKEMLHTLGIPEEYISGRNKECMVPGLGRTGRYMRQTLGTEWGRQLVHQDIWVYAMQKAVAAAKLQRGDIIVIEDVRFPNEAEYVRKHGAIIYLRDADTSDADTIRDMHLSENSFTVSPEDYMLYNYKSSNFRNRLIEAVDYFTLTRQLTGK